MRCRLTITRTVPSGGRRWPGYVAAVLLFTLAGCATRTAVPALPATLKYADFVYPTVPAALRQTPGAERVDAGWRYLQNDDLRAAEREFQAVLQRNPGFAPASAGEGYVLLARRNHDRALTAFDAAVKAMPGYAPALVGRGQALLELKRDGEALAAFEAAVAADPSLTSLQPRIAVLRFRNVQDIIEAARAAAAAGRLADARVAYGRAIAASPDSAFLHREIGVLERRQGDADMALQHLRQAVALDPSDAESLTDIGAVLEQRRDFAGAEDAYRKAASLEPSAELTARINTVAGLARDARLPAEYRAIAASQQISRGELAALVGVRFERLLAATPPREIVMTDVQNHWAAPWITAVARAGVVEPFENHTFQPNAPVRRGDLAAAVSRLLSLLAAGNPTLRERVAQRPRIADMATTHLSYTAAAVSVAAGVLPLVDGRFQVSRAVSGEEAIQAIERVRALQ